MSRFRNSAFLTFPVVEVLIGKNGLPVECLINRMEIPAQQVEIDMSVGEITTVTITFPSDKVDVRYEQ